jgi:hypothetical protein
MINPGRLILKAWSQLLDGIISVPVFRTDAPSGQSGHYVLIRMEGSSESGNNQEFVTNPVVIVDIVTQFENKIDDTVVFDISSEIDQLLFLDSAHHSLPVQSGIKVTSITRQNETILPEDDGAVPKINRLVARYVHRVLQLQES